MPLPPIAVEIAPSDQSATLVQSLLDACSRAASPVSCLPADQPSPEGVSALAIVVWEPQGDAVRIQVGSQRGESRGDWLSRKISFDESDEYSQRWTAVGFVVGTLASRFLKLDSEATEPTSQDIAADNPNQDPVRAELEAITPMSAVFYPEYVKRLQGSHVKQARTKADMVEAVRDDIRRFVKANGCSRAVAVWCGSTEIYVEPTEVHQSIGAFEKGLLDNDPGITNSMIYAWACLKENVPYANGAPNLTVDTPAALQLSREMNTAVAGKDFKTGQTLMKTILAPGFKARMLGLSGWFSTNILGNRDGEVLDDPASFKSKEMSKLGALEHILQPDVYPELYGNSYHKVRINYYPPRGDAKEGWDNIDIFGWLGYPMQIKVDFLCRDSILAAPLVLDLALFMDLASRCQFRGVQEWLSFYFKSPMTAENLYPEHDLFIQLMKLKNTLRWIMGEELITHLGNEYYD